MVKEIFTSVTVEKREIFHTLLGEMQKNGWTRLNNGHALSGQHYYVMHSKGTNGDTPMYVELSPYCGYDAIGDERYNCTLETDKVSCVINIGSGYDPTTGRVVEPFMVKSPSLFPMVFFAGRRNGYNTASYDVPSIAYDAIVHLYMNVSADFVCMVVVPDVSITPIRKCTISYFGIPEDQYLQEEKSPAYSNMLYGSSAYTYPEIRSNATVLNSPAIMPPKDRGYACVVESLLPPIAPNIEGAIDLCDMYIHHNHEGTRSRLGRGIYAVLGGAVDGDIIEVNDGTTIKRYRYTHLEVGYNGNLTSFPSYYIAIRIS